MRRQTQRVGLVAILVTCMVPSASSAGVLSEAFRAVGRLGARKSVTEVEKQGAAKAARTVTGEVAEAGTRQLVTRSAAGNTAKAAGNLSAQNARRLEMMLPDIETTGKATALMTQLERGGDADRIVDFLWRNKGAIAGGTVLTILIANPDAAIESGERVLTSAIDTGGRHVARPMVEQAIDKVIAPVAGGGIMQFWGFVAAGMLTVLATWTAWRRTRWPRIAARRAAMDASGN